MPRSSKVKATAAKTVLNKIVPPVYTYRWLDATETDLLRTDVEGNPSSVPTDPNNRDYVAFLAWVAKGNEPLPFIPS